MASLYLTQRPRQLLSQSSQETNDGDRASRAESYAYASSLQTVQLCIYFWFEIWLWKDGSVGVLSDVARRSFTNVAVIPLFVYIAQKTSPAMVYDRQHPPSLWSSCFFISFCVGPHFLVLSCPIKENFPDGGFRIRLAKNINEKNIVWKNYQIDGILDTFSRGGGQYLWNVQCVPGGFSHIAVNIIFFKRPKKNGLPFV